jgi:hypothetical protein
MPTECDCCHRTNETVRSRSESILEFESWQGRVRRPQAEDFLCDKCVDHYPHYVPTGDGGEILECPLLR